MSFKNVDLQFLRSFVCIVDLGGFYPAADKMSRTQSAISQQMERLEKELGFPLFEKKGRRKLVTSNGIGVYNIAKDMLKLNDELYAQAKVIADSLENVNG